MVPVDSGTHSTYHVEVIRRDIKPGSVERSIDVENGIISEKTPKGIPLGTSF
jgi:hypothetical protein